MRPCNVEVQSRSGREPLVHHHSLGHKMMHPGNHLWIYQNTMLGYRYEREANDFAYALLMDAREAVREGLTCSWEVADHFGVPDRTALLQAPLVLE